VFRITPIVLIACAASCSLPPEATPVRTVLVQYASMPTSDDSVAVSRAGRAPATMYRIINSIGVETPFPVSEFASLRSNPVVEDFNNVGQFCAGLSLFVITNHAATTEDSAFVASFGIRIQGRVAGRPSHFAGDFDRSKLSALMNRINQLADDPNIASADLDLGPCPGFAVRSDE
jgi:hypothetical protein